MHTNANGATTLVSIEQTHRMLNLLGLPIDTTDGDLIMVRFEEMARRASTAADVTVRY